MSIQREQFEIELTEAIRECLLDQPSGGRVYEIAYYTVFLHVPPPTQPKAGAQPSPVNHEISRQSASEQDTVPGQLKDDVNGGSWIRDLVWKQRNLLISEKVGLDNSSLLTSLDGQSEQNTGQEPSLEPLSSVNTGKKRSQGTPIRVRNSPRQCGGPAVSPTMIKTKSSAGRKQGLYNTRSGSRSYVPGSNHSLDGGDDQYPTDGKFQILVDLVSQMEHAVGSSRYIST